MKNIWKRIIAALIGLPLFILIIFLGNYYLLSLLSLLVIIGNYELKNIFEKKGAKIPFFVYIFNLLIFWANCLLNSEIVILGLFAVVFFFASYYIFSNKINNAVLNLASIILIILYSSFFSYIYKTWNLTNSYYLLAFFIFIWIMDTFAYFTGLLIGKNKNIIKVSPKKSLEGFLAGLIFPILASYLMVKFFPHLYKINILLVCSSLIGIFGQMGDLIESMFKRDAAIKDSGKILFGHGGVLDRFDSALFAFPCIYYVLNLLIF